MEFHLHNADFMELGSRPSQAKTGDIFKIPHMILGFEGPACRGRKIVEIILGTYQIVSRKHFRGGTQTIKQV